MDGLDKLNNTLAKRKEKNKQYLHSASHVIADEFSSKLNDRPHFALYLGMAKKHDESFLRSILGQVLESKNVQNPGKLFSYLVKKSKDSQMVK